MTDDVKAITMFLVSLLSPPTLRSVIVPPYALQGTGQDLYSSLSSLLPTTTHPLMPYPHMAGHIRTLLSSSYS